MDWGTLEAGKRDAVDARKIAILKAVPLFATLDDDQLGRVVGLSSDVRFDREQIILQQDEPGDALYILIEGRVKVVLYGEDGREVILSTLRDGDFFGEMALIDGGPRSASVVAVEDSRLVRIRRAPFLGLLREHPELSLRILEALTRRLRVADGRIGSLALMDVYGRVARALRELAQEEGQQRGRDLVLVKRPTHQELAAMAGTSRETVSRVLGDFARTGLCTIDGRSLILHDEFVDGLE